MKSFQPPITGEIRLHIDGQNEYVCLPLWKTPDGSFYLPREKELVFNDGVPFLVTQVEWRYVDKELTSVVVHAESPDEQCDAVAVNIATRQETTCVHNKRNHPVKDGRPVHMTPAGVTWVMLNG